MKRLLLLIIIALCANRSTAQNPGLVISEILANPAGTDSCREYVELLATQNINFSLTPYTVIVNNNGTASSLGWAAGGSLSYAFSINSGSVNTGDVVYVGGNCMTHTGTAIRAIMTQSVGGDGGIGNANGSGVFGNGGGNADGVAVFSVAVSAITSSTIPTDAYFYGTAIGSASISGGTTGYQLPVNDLYSGGKLGNSYFGPDPASDIIITLTGVYNTNSNTWATARTASTGSNSSVSVSSVSLTTSAPSSPVTILFLSNDTTVTESAGSSTVFVKVLSTSTASASITITASGISNASAADFTIAAATITIPANTAANSTFPVVINITNDNINESAEYIVLRFSNPQNATVGSVSQFAFYIADNDRVVPAPSNALALNLLSSYSNSFTGSNSAEIVVHDPSTQRLYIANSIGAKLDIINFINPSNPVLLYSVPIATYGNINSVAVFNGTVAAAIENINPQDSGSVVFFNKDGVFLKQVKVGMMPDMITFNHAGTKVLTANEGEPNTSYTVDPDGSVSIINIAGGISALTQSNVAHVTFTAYNGQESTLRAQGIRIYGPNATTSKDFEPEYISVSKDDTKAWVTLQENNAILEIDLSNNSITSLRALGTKDHSLVDNGLDLSNVTRSVNISNFPIKGFYLPDAIASYTVGGVNYLITANEGDARAYNAFSEEVRVGAANLDATKFPLGSHYKNNYVLGRLNITNKSGDIDNDGDLDTIYSYGSRSFSIWNASTGVQVYDSKDDLELITATNSYSVLFNASNANNTKKDRSDDKGPEPEGVTIGVIGNNTYAFIAVERIGGVMVYDVSNPLAPVFVTYVNNRTTSALGPDLGSEGIIFIPQSQSPNGQHIVIAANEVSSTLSIWGIAGCASPISSSLTVSGTTVNACSNNSPLISVASATNLSYQWSLNGTAISGATLNTLSATQSGNYSVAITGGTNCSTSSLSQSLNVNASPTIAITGQSVLCAGSAISQTVTGANSYSLNGVSTGSVFSISPGSVTVYTVIGSANNCLSTISKTVQVNALPSLTVTGASSAVCQGQPVVLTASGANSYTWSNQTASASISFSALSTNNYSVTGTGTNGCSNTAVQQVTVNPLPPVAISTSTTQICQGGTVVLTASGANSYTWSNQSNLATQTVTPLSGNSYTLSGTGLNGCDNFATTTINILPLPSVSVQATSSVICAGESITLTASGANSYSWNTGHNTPVVTFTPASTTVYTVTGTSQQNCSARLVFTQSVSICTDLHSPSRETEFAIYPNPARNEVTIGFTHAKAGRVNILNSAGMIVLSENNYQSKETINISSLKAGIYVVQIIVQDGYFMKKLVVQ